VRPTETTVDSETSEGLLSSYFGRVLSFRVTGHVRYRPILGVTPDFSNTTDKLGKIFRFNRFGSSNAGKLFGFFGAPRPHENSAWDRADQMLGEPFDPQPQEKIRRWMVNLPNR
jgi:hypothetical protein